MNLREQRKALIAEARTIAEKAKSESREFTPDEVARANEIKSEVEDLTAKIEAADEAAKAVAALTADAGEDEVADAAVLGGGAKSGVVVHERPQRTDTIGDAFTKSDVYKAFAKAYPSGVGNGSNVALGRVNVGSMNDALQGRKSLITTADAHVQNLRYPTVDLIDRPRLTLLDLISRGSMAGAFEYLQITGVQRNAAIVAEATGATDEETGEDLDPLKPISSFTTALADAKPYTYADGFEITNQMLSDAPALATWMNTELRYNLDTKIEEVLLDGSGTNGEPRGILHTSGVQNQSFVTDALTTIRKAITRVTRVGGTVTAVLVSPELDEELDLLKDANERFLGQGPWGTGPATIWGRPRVVSELLSGTNQAILGDFRTVALLDREGLSIEAFNQHKDFAQRNKVYVRAELRAGQVIWRPNRLVVAEVAA